VCLKDHELANILETHQSLRRFHILAQFVRDVKRTAPVHLWGGLVPTRDSSPSLFPFADLHVHASNLGGGAESCKVLWRLLQERTQKCDCPEELRELAKKVSSPETLRNQFILTTCEEDDTQSSAVRQAKQTKGNWSWVKKLLGISVRVLKDDKLSPESTEFLNAVSNDYLNEGVGLVEVSAMESQVVGVLQWAK